jgi:hypothetical protein
MCNCSPREGGDSNILRFIRLKLVHQRHRKMFSIIPDEYVHCGCRKLLFYAADVIICHRKGKS